MQKMNFEINPSEEFEKNKQILFNKYQNDPKVKALLQQMTLDPIKQSELLSKYVFKINQWMLNDIKCDCCKGLKDCPYIHQGIKPSLHFNGTFIEDTFTKCHYLLDIQQKYAFLNNYVANDYAHLKDYRKKDLLKLKVHGNSGEKALDQIVALINDFKLNKGGYIYGTLGCGKTISAAIIANEYAAKGYKVATINIVSFIEQCKQSFNTYSSNSIEDRLYTLKKCDLLVVDDLGCENNTSWSRDEILFNLFNYRMEHHKTTWITSNLDYAALETHFSHNANSNLEGVKAARLMERIKALTTPIFIQGINLRQ